MCPQLYPTVYGSGRSDFRFRLDIGKFVCLRRRTRFTEIGTFIFLSGQKFPRNRRFLSFCAKTGCGGAERFRGKSYVPPALSIGIWVRAIGLPVWTGHRQVCHFFLFVFLFVFCPHDSCSRLQATVFEISRCKFAGGLPYWWECRFAKNFGGRTPLGENFSPNFFSRFRSENVRESCPLPRKKYAKKNFTIGYIGPELQRPTCGVQRVRVDYAARRRLCRRAIGHVTVTSK